MKKTLKEIADLTQSQLIGDPNHIITSFNDIESAGSEEISFYSAPNFDHARHSKALQTTQAGALFIDAKTPQTDGKNYLIHRSPSLAFQAYIETLKPQHSSAFQGIHPTAIVHETAILGNNVIIGPYTVIDQNTKIGNNTKIGPHCTVYFNTTIGENCTIHANVTLRENITLHNNITIQPGAVIGSCGFGYITDEKGHHKHLKQIGTVIIEDDVDIGANTTIDRSRFKETRIKRGTKIDNLVQIGHGVKLGEDNIIVSQTGIAGSTETGRHVVLGGQVAVNGHIKLTDNVAVTAKSGVSKSLTTPGNYGGIPVLPLKDYNRNSVYLRNIEKTVKQIKDLEKRLTDLEKTN